MILICKIIEKRGEKILVEIENQIITLPESCFSENIQPGEQLHLYFWDDHIQIENKKLAKEILEEILNGK